MIAADDFRRASEAMVETIKATGDRFKRLAESMKARPTCGEDFCTECGDCIACYGDDECGEGGSHFWPKPLYGESVLSRCCVCLIATPGIVTPGCPLHDPDNEIDPYPLSMGGGDG